MLTSIVLLHIHNRIEHLHSYLCVPIVSRIAQILRSKSMHCSVTITTAIQTHKKTKQCLIPILVASV